jgi:hypothetical protein
LKRGDSLISYFSATLDINKKFPEMSHREQISLVKVLEFIRFVSFEAIRQRGDDICSMLNIIGNIIMKYFHFMFQIQWMFGRFILQFKTFHISKGNIIM